MEETKRLLRQIARRDEAALECAIRRYSAYVYTVVHNRGRGLLPSEDEEEICSDVFLALWDHAAEIFPPTLKSWLGCVARNRCVDALRKRQLAVSLDECLSVDFGAAFESISDIERRICVRQALESLNTQDRELFYRFYDLCQTTNEIAAAMSLNPATVRTRLKRGREALRRQLCCGRDER